MKVDWREEIVVFGGYLVAYIVAVLIAPSMAQGWTLVLIVLACYNIGVHAGRFAKSDRDKRDKGGYDPWNLKY